MFGTVRSMNNKEKIQLARDIMYNDHMIPPINWQERCDYCNQYKEHCEELPPIRRSMDTQVMVLVCPDCRGEYEQNYTVYWENRD